MRRNERGISLLETTLALSLVAGLSTGLFMLGRSQQQMAATILEEFKAPRQAAQALLIISKELANARPPLTEASSTSVAFSTINNELRRISLAPEDLDDPFYRPLVLEINGVATRLNAERMIQNHNPGRTRILRRNLTVTTGAVDLFTYLDGNGNPTLNPALIRRVEILVVLRPRPDSPARYVRTSVTLRN